MEVKSAKHNPETSIKGSHKDEEQLIREAEAILSQHVQPVTSSSSFFLYGLTLLFVGSAAFGMLTDANTYSYLAFGTAIIAGLGITRLLK